MSSIRPNSVYTTILLIYDVLIHHAAPIKIYGPVLYLHACWISYTGPTKSLREKYCVIFHHILWRCSPLGKYDA